MRSSAKSAGSPLGTIGDAAHHAALHFFGSIDEEEVASAWDAVRPVVRAQSPLVLGLAGLGSFPSTGPPRVLWQGVCGETSLLGALAEACSSALKSAGFVVERRSFRAHCTLRRPRQPWPAAARHRWRELCAAAPSTPVFDADRGVLYESITGSAGARHLPRHVLHFAPR